MILIGIIVNMKQGDPVYFYSKNEKQYGPGTLDVEKKGGFWKVNKIVKIPEFAEDDDPSKYNIFDKIKIKKLNNKKEKKNK